MSNQARAPRLHSKRFSDGLSEFYGYAGSTYASGTVAGFRQALGALHSWVGDIYIHNVTAAHVDGLILEWKDKGISTGTINWRTGRLKTFFTFARGRRWAPVSWDPIGARKALRYTPPRPLRVPVERFGEFLDSADNERDRAAFAVALFTLVRRSELATMRVRDLRLSEGEINVTVHKSDLLDAMPISSELDLELRRWLRFYESCCGILHNDWFLIPSKSKGSRNEHDEKGRIIAGTGNTNLIPDRHPTGLDMGVHRALTRMGYTELKGCGMHTLRRSGARARFDILQQEGYDGALRQVSAMLHHDRSSTTEIYLGIDLDIRNRNEAVKGKPMYGRPPVATGGTLKVLRGGRA